MITGLNRRGGNHVAVLRPMVPNQIRPDAEIAEQEMECSVCKYNVDWACQHIDCKLCPGEQRLAGTLKAIIRRANFRCPLT